MKQTLESEILFDDVVIIEAMRGTAYGSITDNLDCTNNINDCTNNFYASEDDEKHGAAKIA